MLRILLYGQKEWDMKQIMFIESPLPYFVLKNAILYKRENITMYHNVSCTHRLHMHGNTLTLLYIPRTIQDFHAHLYVPCAIQDFHASLVLPKGRIDYIRPLGHIGFSCIYTSLGPYRIYMHLYVPWAV